MRRNERTRFSIVTLLVFTLCTSNLFAQDSPAKKQLPSWPNWMGPNRDGISTETNWKTDWPESGLPVKWSKQIGIGFSSVSVHNGKLYTMGHKEGEEIVWCLNANTGDVDWTYNYPGKLLPNLHEGGPGTTPTVHDGRLYTLGKEGQLYCFNAETGNVLWQNELQSELDVPLPEWGFSSSPVIHKEMVIFEAGRVVAFNRVTGKKIWQTDKHVAGYGSAAVFNHKGRDLLATLDCDGFRVLNATDGSELAFQTWKSPFQTNATTPIVQGDKIYISTGYQIGCGLFQFDGDNLTKIYSNRGMRNHFNNSILYKGHLYGFDGNSNLGRIVRLTCMDFATGEIKWQQRGLGCGSLMIADGKLVILAEDGTLVLAKATPDKFEELSRSEFLEGRCWTVPVFVGKKIYGRNAAGKLVCVDVGK